MKKIFFMLLLMPCWCMAQPITDTTGTYKFGGRLVTDTSITFGNGLTIQGVVHDSTSAYYTLNEWIDAAQATRGVTLVITVKVIMLACDTSSWSGGKLNALGQVYWDYGYRVTEETSRICLTYFLDEKKRRLPENIIVWYYKEIKP